MKTILWTEVILMAILMLTSLSNVLYAQGTRTETEALSLSIDVYIYGYPLVTMEITRRGGTSVVGPEEEYAHAPMGQFAHLKTFPDASFKDVTAPNADTLYSSAFLDLSREPYILHAPDENGRYYMMPMLDGWTNVFAAPGTRTTGTKAADFAITGPGWKGTLPTGLKEYKSPTNLVWIIGRTYCLGTQQDYQVVQAIQNQYTLTPLSAFGRPYTPPKGTPDATVDKKTPVRDQVNRMNTGTFFKVLAELMKDNPPAAADAQMVEKMSRIGMVPGKDFDINKIDPAIVSVLPGVPKAALEKIVSHRKDAGVMVNGWLVRKVQGIYGTDYLQRAFQTFVGLGTNLREDAIYPQTIVDKGGKPLTGASRYMIHFPKGGTPPTNAFWSLTMYNTEYFFVANPLNRYNLSSRDKFNYNLNGSLDLYIQKDSPGRDKESNWLPAPTDKFVLSMRIYWPKESVLDGSWNIPPVQRVE